jgi:hypothetical protein
MVAVLQELIPLAERDRWEAALAGVPHGPAHTWGFAAAMQATWLYHYERDGFTIVCPLLERPAGDRVDVATPGGFNGFAGTGWPAQFAQDWRAFAAEQRWVCAYVVLHPAFCDASGFPPSEVAVHNELYLLDLSSSHEQLVARMSRNRRRQLRDCESRRGELVSDRARLAAFLVATYDDFFKRKGGGPSTRLATETLERLAGLPDAVLVGAEGPAGIEALLVVAHTACCADSVFAVSVPGGEGHAALLHWHAIEQLRALGVPQLNMGGGLRPGDPIAEFKRRFGAQPAPLRSIRQIYDADAYARLCAARGVDPAAGGYFPAYR